MSDVQGGLGVAQAAKRLGISPAALRRRIDRRTVSAYKGEDGRWYVIVDSDGGTGGTTRGTMIHATPEIHQDTPQTAVDGELAKTLREQLSFLQREIEARDDEIKEMRRVHANQIHELHVLVQTAQQNEQRLLSAHAPEHDGRPLGRKRNANAMSSIGGERSDDQYRTKGMWRMKMYRRCRRGHRP